MLTLKYRPVTLSDITGQRHITIPLTRMAATNRLPTALLLTGPRGTGKTSLARVLASLSTPSDVIELDAASHGSVTDIRALTEALAYAPPPNRSRLVVLDEVQSFSREAFNALLRILEEPPPDTRFVLITTQPRSVPETVLSRLMHFEFSLISADDIENRLQFIVAAEGITADGHLIRELALRAAGSLRVAVMSLDMCARADISAVEEYRALLGVADVGPGLLAAVLAAEVGPLLELVRAAVAALGTPMAVGEALTGTLRDVLMLRSGGSLLLFELALEARVRLARELSTEEILAGLRLMWDLRVKPRSGEDSALALEVAVVLLCDLLGSRKMKDHGAVGMGTAAGNGTVALAAPNGQALTLDQLREET